MKVNEAAARGTILRIELTVLFSITRAGINTGAIFPTGNVGQRERVPVGAAGRRHDGG